MSMENVEDFYPLSPLQQGLLFHTLTEQTSRLYFNQTIATLRGELDLEAFEQAWQRVVKHHAILRTFFVWKDVKQPIQVVQREARMPLDTYDWRDLDEDQQREQFESLRVADLERGFDLSQAPLMRLSLVRMADDRHDFLWSFHHILMDGWSMSHVLREIFGSYDAAMRGETLALETPPRYRDYIAWLQRQSMEAAETFWRDKLAGFTHVTPVVDDGSEGDVDGAHENNESIACSLTPELSDGLAALAMKNHLTLSTVLQGAWAVLIGRCGGADDVLVGTVVSGRPGELDGVESMVGLFINTLAGRIHLSPEAPVLDMLQQIQIGQADLREYEYSPLYEVQGWSEVSGGTLFNSIFLFENYLKGANLAEMCTSLEICDVQWLEGQNYHLAAIAIPGPQMSLRINYRTSSFQRETIERMLGHWRTVLEGMVANPQGRVADLPLVTEPERQQLLVEWNAAGAAELPDDCLHQVFEQQVQRTPDAVAVTDEAGAHTYRELNSGANRLARHLRTLGVGPDVVVGLALGRSVGSIRAALAVLKAGGAYAFLDTDGPKDSVAGLMAAARMPVVLTAERLADALPPSEAHVLCLDEDATLIDEENDADLDHVTVAQDLAAVLGRETPAGEPESVRVSHRAMVRAARAASGAVEDEVFVHLSPLSSRESVLELWGGLLSGARVVVAGEGAVSLPDLGTLIRREKVTTLCVTAARFRQLVHADPADFKSLRQVWVHGDVLPAGHVSKVLARLPGSSVNRCFGPVETVGVTCVGRMTGGQPVHRSVPAGRPQPGTTCYVLDAALRPVPIGVVGEVYIGGHGLARDYLDQPALTAERFIKDPHSSTPGARLFRTGTRARFLPSGELCTVGSRGDTSLLELALCECAGVRDAAVVMREDEPGNRILVAYVVPEPGSPVESETLRELLTERLPGESLPTVFVAQPELTLTAAGKVDQAALPRPEAEATGAQAESGSPRTELEEIVVGVWKEVLGRETVGIHDNFFDIGGHSMRLVLVHGKLEGMLQRQIEITDLFRYSTVSALVKFLDDDEPEAPAPEVAEQKRQSVESGKARLQQLRRRRSGKP